MASEDLFVLPDSEEFAIESHQERRENKSLTDNQIENVNTEPTDTSKNVETIDEAMEEENCEDDETLNKGSNGNEGDKAATSTTKVQKVAQEPKLVQLPLSKIRSLMKLDPDMNLASTEAVFSVAKATELFIESLAKESYSFTAQSKKKTVQKRDVDLAIASVDSLMFLEGSMNF